jgi:tryptophan synthase alpha chain
MSDIAKLFERLKEQGNKALIGYVTAGDPKPEFTPLIAEALVKGGVDIIELGVPFSDPIADGPTIQAASVRSLQKGTTPKIVLGMAGEIKRKQNVPVVILTYFNPVFRMGIKTFFRLAKSFGVDGVVIPDLPIEEAEEYRKIAQNCGVDTIFLVAPSTSNKRMRKIIACTSGFLYVISHFGVTGAREKLEDSTFQLVKRVLPFTTGRIPLAVGFGISKPEHVKSISEVGADAVIVGSAFVRIIQNHQSDLAGMLEELEVTARNLKNATSSANTF